MRVGRMSSMPFASSTSANYFLKSLRDFDHNNTFAKWTNIRAKKPLMRDSAGQKQYVFWTKQNCFSGLSTKSLRGAALARNKRDLVAATERPASLAISF